MDITSAAIATIISVITSSLITLVLKRQDSRKALDDQLDSILKIAIQYPKLECRKFASEWTSKYDRDDEVALRYEMYCTMVFNYMERLARYYKYDEGRIESHVALKSWARIHSKYWLDPTEQHENIDAYDKKFVALMSQYLKGV